MTRKFRGAFAICFAILFSFVVAGCSREATPTVEATYSSDDLIPVSELLASESDGVLTDPGAIEVLYQKLGGKQLFWSMNLASVDRVSVVRLTDDTSEQSIVNGYYATDLVEFDSEEEMTFSLAAGAMKSVSGFKLQGNTLKASGKGTSIPAEEISIVYSCPADHTAYAVAYTLFHEDTEKSAYVPVGQLVLVFEENSPEGSVTLVE